MSIFSKAVYNNTPYNKNKELVSEGAEGNPIPMKVGDSSPIKHIFYIIKENRTYDQVLGDIPEGNGDRNLVLFGENITPNLHAIAREFVLLDNFYVNGEVSADGHHWVTSAYATDYVEKFWPAMYSGRGRKELGHRRHPHVDLPPVALVPPEPPFVVVPPEPPLPPLPPLFPPEPPDWLPPEPPFAVVPPDP